MRWWFFLMFYNFLAKIYVFPCKGNNRGKEDTYCRNREKYFTVALAGPQLGSCMNKGDWNG